MKRKYYIGIDVGGTKIAAALVDGNGQIVDRKKMPTPQGAKAAEIFKAIKKIVLEIISDHQLSDAQIQGIGLGIPGVVKPNMKEILITPNINLDKFPLVEKLRSVCNTEIVLGNDVNVGLLGEKWMGIGREANNIIGLFPGTGVGGAIIIDGKLIVGSDGAAGEIGHMIMDLSSPHECAGVKGSLEALAARRAIERDIRSAIEQGQASTITDQIKSLGQIKSKVLKEALKREDRVTTEIVERVCEVIGKACISLRHILNPEMIILGGGVMEACGFFMLPRIRKISEKDPFFKGIDSCDIVLSQLGDDAVLLGAVALVRQAQGDTSTEEPTVYPELKYANSKGISVNGKIVPQSFYIRADGRMKKIFAKDDSEGAVLSGQLEVSSLKKFCKKDPDVLIISARKKGIKVTSEAKQYLKSQSIDYQILPHKDAVKLFHQTEGRKAFFALL